MSPIFRFAKDLASLMNEYKPFFEEGMLKPNEAAYVLMLASMSSMDPDKDVTEKEQAEFRARSEALGITPEQGIAIGCIYQINLDD